MLILISTRTVYVSSRHTPRTDIPPDTSLAPLINGCFRYTAEPVDAKRGGIPQMFGIFFFFFFSSIARKAIYSSVANTVFFHC